MLFIVKALSRGQKVVDKVVEATDLEQAVQIGQKGCDESAGAFKYIGAERFIWWDATILGVEPVAKKARVGA